MPRSNHECYQSIWINLADCFVPHCSNNHQYQKEERKSDVNHAAYFHKLFTANRYNPIIRPQIPKVHHRPVLPSRKSGANIRVIPIVRLIFQKYRCDSLRSICSNLQTFPICLASNFRNYHNHDCMGVFEVDRAQMVQRLHPKRCYLCYLYNVSSPPHID